MIFINGRFLTQDITGVQRFAFEITKGLSKIIDDLKVLVPDKSQIKGYEGIDSLKIVEVPGFNGHLWEQITLPIFLYKNKNNFLVNLCNTAPLFKKNQIVSHHDITYIRYPESFSFSFRLFYRIISPVILKNANYIITVSDFSKGELIKTYRIPEGKIHVVPNAVSGEFNETLKEKRNYILAVSSPAYHKNFHGLVRAFKKSKIQAELKIIGKAASNFSHIDEGTADKRIDYLGRVDDRTLVELYQHARAFVFPSFYEGFGIPPLEAQACGCPVVSSNLASMPEVLQDSAEFFDPTSDDAIIKAIENVLDNNLRSCELVEKGRGNLNRFSWGSSAKKVQSIINIACVKNDKC